MIPWEMSRRNPMIDLRMVATRQFGACFLVMLATGAILLQIVTGVPLGVPSLIGVLMLIGIVVTNAIVLVDLINQYREGGMTVRDAVEHGASRRLRPILMTALATIFALLPMAMGITGHGGFISQPLAVVVIGGLVSSTLLTLLLVPVLYLLIERTNQRRHERHVRRRAARAATTHPRPLTAPASLAFTGANASSLRTSSASKGEGYR